MRLLLLVLLLGAPAAGDWPRFRGPNGSGLQDAARLPAQLGATRNVVWKTALPPGYSSPVVSGDRIFLTAFEGDKLLTLALDRATGEERWRRESPRSRTEKLDRRNGPASPTPVADGENVYVFFPDYGLLSYTFAGAERWRTPLGPFNNVYGMGASPVLAGDLVVLVCDQNRGSFAAGFRQSDGREVWRRPRPEALSGHSTPIVYEPAGGPLQVIAPGSFRMDSYAVATGESVSWVNGLPGEMKSGPVLAGDTVYVNGFSTPDNDPGRQVIVPPFAEVLARQDANKDGKISPAEAPDERTRRYFLFIDLDEDGAADAAEWRIWAAGSASENGLLAFRAGGRGDLSGTSLRWRYSRSVPQLPTTLVYRGVVYMINDGGVLTTLDAETGKVKKQDRLRGAVDHYYASPVAGDGKVYIVSQSGVVVVLDAARDQEILSTGELDDEVYATPAIAGGRIFIRTRGALYAFGEAPPPAAPTASAAPSPFQLSPEERARLDQLAREDHADMMRQLGITKLRPGANGRAAAGEPGAANYDPALANPYPDWPDVLTLADGGKVTTAEGWWKHRRPEIVESFEREVYGRVPADVPRVIWTVSETVPTTVGGQPVVARRVVGHVDNAAHPAISVDIKMAVVVPVNAKGPVPVLMMFGWGNMPGEAPPRFPGLPEPAAPPSPEQLIAAGWGYVSLSTTSIQADNGAGLTAGIIGLTNKGQRRTPAQWGTLRAWAWGAARALDYLETLPAVDARRVGIEGVSRYGKAALVTMAFEPRFALVLVGSSGEGGAKPHRRHFGEQVENLTGSGQYHWMAGNFLKYGAAEAAFGSKNAGDIPVDAHQLIALCAPRPTFISYGIPEKGDANWLDQQGSFMATVAAGPVFRLLGVRDLGVNEDYRVARMAPHNTSLLDGALAWRQHDGGHEDRSNMSFFLAWANRLLRHTPPTVPADQPRVRADRNSHLAHQQLLAKAKTGGIDVYFVGDSITRRWGALDYPDFLAHWRQSFHGWNAGNFGWGGDRTENILWRLENGELDGVHPKVIVILAGTNNVGKEPGDESKVADVTRGLTAIVRVCRQKAPAATIVLTAIFPRNDDPAVVPTIARINANLATLADGKAIRFLDVNAGLADAKGTLFAGMSADGLHPSLKGYEVWAAGLKPIFTELLGPPAATDHAPPPTGDPSAAERASR